MVSFLQHSESDEGFLELHEGFVTVIRLIYSDQVIHLFYYDRVLFYHDPDYYRIYSSLNIHGEYTTGPLL